VVKEKWTAFEQKREQFVKAGNEANATDSTEFKDAEQIHKEYSAATAELKQLEQVRNGVFSMLASTGAPAMSNQKVERNETKSLSERALESPEYKGLVDSGALHSDKRSFVATLAEMTLPEVKALITGVSDTSAGAFITNQRESYVAQPRRMSRIMNLITMGETSVDAIEYARQTTFTNVAVEVAEATSTTTGTKPEATIAFEKVTETVKTIAHWIPATRRALADESQLRTLIDSQLRYGLEFRLENADRERWRDGRGPDRHPEHDEHPDAGEGFPVGLGRAAQGDHADPARVHRAERHRDAPDRTGKSCGCRATTRARCRGRARTCTARRRRRWSRRSGASRSR
jgi:HK97 family phage major capsid protein